MCKKVVATVLLAGTMSANAELLDLSKWHPYLSLGVGATHTEHSQDVQLSTAAPSGLVNRFNNHTWSHLTAQLAFGSERSIYKVNETSDICLGIEGSYLRTDGAAGEVLPAININSNFDRLNFGYDIESYLLLAKAKLKRANIYKTWGGYLDAGVGIAANHSSNYIETIPPGSTTVPMLSPFGDNTRSSIAYGVGFGFTHVIGSHSEMSIGYRYINSGRGAFAISPVQDTTQTLKSALLGHHLLSLNFRA